MSRSETPDPRIPPPEIVAERIRELHAIHADRVAPGVPLADLTTFRIGGPALGMCRLQNVDDARRFQELAVDHGIPVFFMGGGSNILADDRGFAGLVLKVEIDRFSVTADTVTVGAGLGFDDLISRSLEAGLTGLEFASGIPGTVGGAVVGNAGCYGHEIGEFLVSATLLRPDGRLETIGPDGCGFGYRTSALKGTRNLLLEVELRLGRGDLAVAGEIRSEKMADRRRKHPWRLACAGSYFQNLPPAEPGGRRRAAGALLEQVGAKEFREGDAGVFSKHANIIVNHGSATCRQVLTLAERMKDAVREAFDVELVEEVRHLRWRPDALLIT